MKILKQLFKATLLTATIALPSFAATTHDTNSKMRIAVIKGAIGSNDIINGNYQQATSKISSLTSNKQGMIEYSMGLCAAFIKLEKLNKAKQACSKAITSLNSLKKQSRQVKYLTAMSYSNRGIAKYLADDTKGAYEDMITAINFDSNDVVMQNLLRFKKTVTVNDSSLSTMNVANNIIEPTSE